MLVAISQPCETRMMLNRLTQMLNAYTTHPIFMRMSHQKPTSTAIENKVARFTAVWRLDFTASFV